MKAEGLSSEGLGSEGSPVSWESRPRSARRITKKTNAAAAMINSTSMAAAATQLKRSDDDWKYARHKPVNGALLRSNMCECPIPGQGRRAEKHDEDCSGS